jgi:hypothetical protein
MKKLIIFLVSGMLLLSSGANAENIKKSENLNLKCEINRKTTELYTPFKAYKNIPKLSKTLNLNLANYKWSHKVERFPIHYYNEKRKEIIMVQDDFIIWDEVLLGDKINKEYTSKNSNDINAQLYRYLWGAKKGEFSMSVYNLNEKYLQEYYSYNEGRIKADFVIPKDDSRKKTLTEKLNEEGYFSANLQGDCVKI